MAIGNWLSSDGGRRKTPLPASEQSPLSLALSLSEIASVLAITRGAQSDLSLFLV